MKPPQFKSIHFLVLSFLLACQPLLAQDLVCTDCHDTENTSPLHGGFDCSDCHTNILEMPHQEKPLGELGGSDLCAQCHSDSQEAVAESVHFGIAECTNCHGDAHGILPPSDILSPTSPFRQMNSCGECHDVDHFVDNFVRSVHGHALVVSGLVNAPSCADCHGNHRILSPSEPESSVSREHVPDTCGRCHLFILSTWRSSTHGQLWESDQEGPVCTTCHSSHEVQRPTSRDERLKFPNNCGGCHSHELETYRDSFHGQATNLGFMTAATCGDCHTPHLNLPASDPQSSVHPNNLKGTCESCHPGINDAFLTFQPHVDPADKESDPLIHYVWLFMTTLLFSVFGFFGIHDFLWLQRSAVGFLKGEFDAIRKRGGPYVRRFDKVAMGVHVTIVTSFLLLAATGLPLKFHYTEWSPVVASFFGGIETARVLHRLAAIVTSGYAFFHLAHSFHRIVLKKDYGLLWGARSLVPSPQDIRDLYQNIRYFLYMGERPKFGRWTYWEKFDYFAVFWGVAIIGFSGLALWLPDLFTTFLPGWVLNIAYIVHSDEALLATGFIFVFHFFHTHLRPEVFPLDRVIFTGRMSLERFREERPLEYEQLVREGRLEEFIVEDPTPLQIRRAFIFGFTAVGIGLALVIGMLAAFLLY